MPRWHTALRTGANAVLAVVAFGLLGHAQVATAEPTVRLRLTSVTPSDRLRIETAAAESLRLYAEWLGPLSLDAITVDDRRDPAALEWASGLVHVNVPWKPAPASMDLESQVAYGVATQWWPHLARDAASRPFAVGLAWYLQSRVVEALFDLAYRRPGHHLETKRFFGGVLPWTFGRLVLSRWTSGLGRDLYLARDTPARGRAGRRLPPEVDARAARAALAFGTLERYLGWPALQAGLNAVATRRRDVGSPEDFGDALGAAVGRDLSWFFDKAFDSAVDYDYALVGVVSHGDAVPCDGGPCQRTTITAARYGQGVFSGRTAAPVGSYSSGDALDLHVTFADGQAATTHWDGRAAWHQVEFDAHAPARAAELDPTRVLLLDRNYLDNHRRVTSENNVPVAKWVAQWLVWLQGVVLTYGFLV